MAESLSEEELQVPKHQFNANNGTSGMKYQQASIPQNERHSIEPIDENKRQTLDSDRKNTTQ